MKYYRTTVADYNARAALANQVEGFPDPRADRALPLAETLPADGDSKVYLAVGARYYENPKYAALFSGVEEVTEQEYAAVAIP